MCSCLGLLSVAAGVDVWGLAHVIVHIASFMLQSRILLCGLARVCTLMVS